MGKILGVEVEYAWIKYISFDLNVPNEPPETEGYRHLLRLAAECQDANRVVVAVPVPTSKTFVLWETERMISMVDWLDYVGSEEGRVVIEKAIAEMKEELAGYEWA